MLQALWIVSIIENRRVEKGILMQKNNEEEFKFIKEKIKDKPLNKKRLLSRGAATIAAAVVFGFVACLVFTLMRPVMEDWFHKPKPTQVILPKDEMTEAYDEPETETGTADGTEADTQTEDKASESTEFTVEDFQKMQTQLYSIGTQTNRSMVTVTGVKSDTDWFNTAYESQGQDSGVIIADTGAKYLIMTEKRVIESAEEIEVTFYNNVTVDAELQAYDANTGIAVLSVLRENVDEATRNLITVATLGNSFQIARGSIIIALGSPLGNNSAIQTGSVIATDHVVSLYDADYKTITTNISGTAKGTGVLVNLNGEIVGLIMKEPDMGADTLTAFSVSQLKDVIEMLSNNQEIPYLGMKISTVNNDIAETYDIPKGIYVKSIAWDSPAMAAGLQNGDVITKIDGEEILTTQAYKNCLLEYKPNTQIEITVKRQGANGYEEMECQAAIGVLK